MTRDDARALVFTALVELDERDRNYVIHHALTDCAKHDDRQARTKTVEIPADVAAADAIAELDAAAVAEHVGDFAANALRRRGVSEAVIAAELRGKR